jgi:anhydro-N-acetylmuramic acid kinase
MADDTEMFDVGGRLASQGHVLEPVLAALLADDTFIQSPPPKSSGREYYGQEYVDAMLALAGPSAAPCDVLATAAALTAEGIYRFTLSTFLMSDFFD